MSPTALLTPAAVRERIRRAILTALVVSDPDARFLAAGNKIIWPETFDPADYPRDVRRRLFEPTRLDLDRYLDDLRWLVVLDKRQRHVVTWVALGRSFRSIADAWGRSHTHWQRVHREAVVAMTGVANGR